MVLTGRVNGILLAILFGIVFLDAVFGDNALWKSVVFGLVSLIATVLSLAWAVWCWRETG